MSVCAISPPQTAFVETSVYEINDDVVTDLCPDVHWSYCPTLVPFIQTYLTESVQCGTVIALKSYWRSNNLHQILFVYNCTCTCLISIYFRHFSTETLTFKKRIFLIICWMSEIFEKQWLSSKSTILAGQSRNSSLYIYIQKHVCTVKTITTARHFTGWWTTLWEKSKMEKKSGVNQILIVLYQKGDVRLNERVANFTLSCFHCVFLCISEKRLSVGVFNVPGALLSKA